VAFFVSFSDFEQLLGKWAEEKPVYVPRYIQDNLHYQRFTPGTQDGIVYDGIRAVEPLKSFFFKIRQRVAEYPPHSSSDAREADPNFIIVGAKACDLKSVEISDDTFMRGEIKDPFYIESRDKVTIISSDCSSPAESCFCTMLNLKPYPEEGFDVNLSKISEGLVVEVGSERGEKLVSQDRELFSEASSSQLEERDKNRAITLSKVKEQNEKFSLNKSYQEIVKEKLDSPVWNGYSGRCVGCAACLSVCPTCHCFLLYDQKVNENFERVRVWDFCYHYGYARVAGGPNPRPTLRDRFKNKYIDKFNFYPANFDTYACTGCGRCIEACLANIDMRQVFKDLEVT
jgi:ferredoxin